MSDFVEAVVLVESSGCVGVAGGFSGLRLRAASPPDVAGVSFPYGDWVICLSNSRYRAMASDERWGTET